MFLGNTYDMAGPLCKMTNTKYYVAWRHGEDTSLLGGGDDLAQLEASQHLQLELADYIDEEMYGQDWATPDFRREMQDAGESKVGQMVACIQYGLHERLETRLDLSKSWAADDERLTRFADKFGGYLDALVGSDPLGGKLWIRKYVRAFFLHLMVKGRLQMEAWRMRSGTPNDIQSTLLWIQHRGPCIKIRSKRDEREQIYELLPNCEDLTSADNRTPFPALVAPDVLFPKEYEMCRQQFSNLPGTNGAHET